MPDLTGFPALDLAIGLSFIFFLLAILASTLQEFIAAVLGLRARTLEQGLRSMLEDPEKGWKVVDDFYDHPLIQRLSRTPPPSEMSKRVENASGATGGSPPSRSPVAKSRRGGLVDGLLNGKAGRKARDATEETLGRNAHTLTRGRSRRALAFFKRTGGPSYLSPRAFAEVVLDLVAPAAQRASQQQAELDALVDSLPPALAKRLRPLADAAVADLERTRKHIEAWYDDTMARVSGWYKRKSQIILLVIGIVLVPLLNANALVIGQRLWKDTELRAAVVAQATAAVATPTPTPEASPTPSPTPSATPTPTPTGTATPTPTPTPTPSPIDVASGKLDDAATSVNNAVKLGVPMGWSNKLAKPHWDSLSGWTTAIGGWLLTIAAISLGAPFWFDLLGRFSRLRSSGKPETPLPATGRGLDNERVKTED